MTTPEPSECWNEAGHRTMVIGEDWCRHCGLGRDEWLLAMDPEERRHAQLSYTVGAFAAWCVNIIAVALPALILLRWLFVK